MSGNDNPVLVYTTCPSMEVAEALAGLAVDCGLAACANILPSMRSIYVWQGVRHTDDEVVMLLKTVQACVPKLIVTLEEAHPYDTPAILVLPTEGGSRSFIAWIEAQTSAGAASASGEHLE